MSTQEIIIDVHNRLWITSNGRYHWADKARRTRELRRIGGMVARARRLRKLDRARVIVHIQYSTRRNADPANAWPTVKAVTDGLIDYGLLPDDDDEHLVGPDMRREKGTCRRGYHRLRIEVTEL